MDSHCCFLVRTFCATYNHENYITDAMNGFVMQKTAFPVVYTIVDDASTDMTADVIRQFIADNFLMDTTFGYDKETDYGHVTFVRHKTNTNCWFAAIYLKENHYSQKKSKAPYLKEWENAKYIALCEGDDYWTDPLKLQKQVDFLESHPDFSMCFHSATIITEGINLSKTGARFEVIEEREYSSTEVFSKWIVPTASIVYRKENVLQFKMRQPDRLTRGDIGLVLQCAHTGRIWGMKDQMSVYRMQPNSVSHNPKYRNPEVLHLPNHFRCILLNFPKVDRKPIKWNISHSYYCRMKYNHSLWEKIRDFLLFCYWDPKFASSKIISVLSKKWTNLFQ